MCICVYVCVCVCVFVCVYLCAHLYVYMYVCLYTCIYVCICMHICIYMCVFGCLYVCELSISSLSLLILCPPLQQRFIECMEEMNARIGRDVESGVTHIIAGTVRERFCLRTVKYLHGVLRGCWILSLNCKLSRSKLWKEDETLRNLLKEMPPFRSYESYLWYLLYMHAEIGLLECKKRKCWVAEEGFEMLGDSICAVMTMNCKHLCNHIYIYSAHHSTHSRFESHTTAPIPINQQFRSLLSSRFFSS